MKNISNKYISQFRETCLERYAVDRADMSMGEWICENTTLAGQKFSFKRYPFQEAIANDLHERVAVKKCSQIGLTEIQIRKTLGYLYRNPYTSGLYSLPDKNLRDVNSKTRIAPMLERDKVFNSGRKGTRSVSQYDIDRSYLHVLNASPSAATSISLDLLMIDEVDLTDEEVLALYSSRLQNSDAAIRQDFSTPSFEDFGIDVSFQNSDQREYMIKCDCCGHYQIPDWDLKFLRIPGLPDDMQLDEINAAVIEGLNLGEAYIMCERCQKPLNLAEGKREWVAAKPGMSQISHGYCVKPFSTDRLGIPYIIQQYLDYSKRDFLRGFYNTVLGQTYSDAKTRLSEADVKQNLLGEDVPEIMAGGTYFLGIDVGAICHIVVGIAKNPEDVAIVELSLVNAKELEDKVRALCKKYNIVCGSIDKYPYTPTAQAVFSATNKKVFPTEYSAGDSYKHHADEDLPDEDYFQLNRTWILDKVAKLFRTKDIPISGYGKHKKTLIAHMQNMVRDEQPEKAAVWKKLNNDDHFFHAIAYMYASIFFADVIYGIGKGDDIREVCATMIATVPTSAPMLYTRNRNNSNQRPGHIVKTTVLG